MLTIWGRPTSSNVQKVVWAAEEIALPYRRNDVGGPFGGLDTAEYRRMNPNGRIPVIEDDGFVLWDSNAIVRYLAQKHGNGTLWPTDAHMRARADQWMDWQQTTLHPAIGPLFLGLVRTPPDKRDPAAIAASTEATARVLTVLEANLADRPYIAGDDLTMGDLPSAVWVQRWFKLVPDGPAFPALRAWLDRLLARPAFVRSVADQPII